jgi:hypothetical protein
MYVDLYAYWAYHNITFIPLEIHESCYYQIVFSLFYILHLHLS